MRGRDYGAELRERVMERLAGIARSDGGATGDTYECQVCHGTFEKVRSDEEAIAEMKDTWQPTSGDDDPGIVCDDCYQQVMAWAQEQAPETLRMARP